MENLKFIIVIDTNIKNFIIEYCESICKKINNCEIIYYPSNSINLETNNIFLFMGLHYTKYPIIYKNNVFYINLEQLTMNGNYTHFNMLNTLLFNKYLQFCDYSLGNISILKEYNIESIYLPYQVNHNEIFNYDKIYNFAVCCNWNARIKNIFEPINNKYDKCFSIGNPIMWGKDRDNILFRTKVLANIHHREIDYNILEEIRITRCILNRIIVISEYSVEYEKYPLAKYVIFVNYENMEKKILEVLENYQNYYNQIYENFDINQIDNILSNYIVNFKKMFIKN